MIGTSKPATTPWVLLDNLFRDDFELGRTDKFSIKTVDVGLPDVIRLSELFVNGLLFPLGRELVDW